jgi:hypothetical protein
MKQFFFLIMAPFNNLLPSHFPLFLHFLKNINSKHSLTFFTFYITSTIFFYYLNKKNPLQNKKYILFYINYFYFISHQSFFTHIQKKNFSYKGRGGEGRGEITKRAYMTSIIRY